jgi:hypothetical protein
MEEFNIQGKQTPFYKYCPGTFGYTLVLLCLFMKKGNLLSRFTVYEGYITGNLHRVSKPCTPLKMTQRCQNKQESTLLTEKML